MRRSPAVVSREKSFISPEDIYDMNKSYVKFKKEKKKKEKKNTKKKHMHGHKDL